MSKKILWGLFLLIFGLFYTLQQFLPENLVSYFLNYQVFLIITGFVYLFRKKNTIGGTLILVGVYLYLIEFFEEYFNLYFPVIVLTSGIVILAWGIYEKKLERKSELEKNKFVFKSKENKENKDTDEVEEIKEVE